MRRSKPIARKRRVKRKRTGPAAELRERADKIWSARVLERDGYRCRRCGAIRYVQAHHVRSRQHWSTRWVLENGLALCRGCHFGAHNHVEADDRVWFYAQFGLDYGHLKTRSLQSAKGIDVALHIVAMEQAAFREPPLPVFCAWGPPEVA